MSFDTSLNRLGRRRSAGRPRFAALRRPRRPNPQRARLILAVVAALVVLGAGYALLRDSSLVRVKDVRVTGIDSSAEPRIDAALDAAARSMTTLHVDTGRLRRAVAGFPSVAGLRVHTSLPHTMSIHVIERVPVAVIVAGGQRIAVSSDGRLLRDVQDTIGLPAIAQATLPVGLTANAPRLRAALTVASAAPEVLSKRSQRILWTPKGLTVQLLDGPPLIFGDATQAGAKWAGATRVLADPSSRGATYLDLREPGRVSAGGLGPVDAEDPLGDAQQPVPGATPTPVPTVPATPTATPTP